MRLVWCLGMYASASTWLFNVVRLIAESQGKVDTCFIAGELDHSVFGRDTWQIVKSHEIADDRTIELVARQAERIFVTIRDPRDAVISLMLSHGYEFERALRHVDASARLCARFAHDERSVFWPYESRFFESAESLVRIETALGVHMDETARMALFNAMQRGKIEEYIATLPYLPGVLQDRLSGDMLDPQTHWHTHHAGRSGEIGRWKYKLTAEQIAAVEARLTDCFSFQV